MSHENCHGGNLFSFPFSPYPQQEQLMQSMHECIESASIGCFESPTGTGKSLSTICAALSWLVDEENRALAKHQNPLSLNTTISALKKAEVDWLQEILQPKQSSDVFDQNKHNEARKVYEEALQDISRARLSLRRTSNNISGVTEHDRHSEFPKKISATRKNDSADDDFILAPYYSDDDTRPSKLQLVDYDDDEDLLAGNQREEEAWDILGLPQIYYCSRTHSQLAQFVSEIKKTAFKSVRCVVLGSRKSSCINQEVQSLRSDQSMNEKCLDLQRTKVSSKISVANSNSSSNKKLMLSSHLKCPYHNTLNEKALGNTLLSDLYDIEDITTIGMERKVCTYYAARRASRRAQIVCMPYSTLFHADVREGVGLPLTKNHVVIIDEAHNLVETLNQIYSTELRLSSIINISWVLKSYLNRFQSCLHGKNLFYLNLLLTVTKKLSSILERKVIISSGHNNSAMTGCNVSESITSVNAFVFGAGLDNINFLKLRKYLLVNNMVNRIGAFADSLQSLDGANRSESHDSLRAEHWAAKSNLRAITSFITSLANQDELGRIVVRFPIQSKDNDDEPILKYVMLHAGATVQPIVDQVRSVLLLGGTMQPFQYLVSVLFPKVAPERLRFFSCSHIVDRSHVFARVINSTGTTEYLEFTHEKRMSNRYTSDLFVIVSNLAKTIPSGLVVFFTSYQYLKLVHSRWLTSGYLAKLEEEKQVFVESKDQSSDVLWERYCNCISRSKTGDKIRGGILLSVIGGRLSEGINFSDDLARGVVVVGMPYPDTRDLILQEKISHFESVNAACNSAAINLAENMCMKAVNQAVGRSIRHVNDYAAIILIDNRYCQSKVQSQLPGWIQQSLKVSALAACCSELSQFFVQMTSNNK